MMRIIKTSILNLMRNKKRTIFSILGSMIGIICFLVISGYYEYNYWGLRESSIRSQYGHLQISKKGYYQNKIENPYNYLIDDYSAIIDKLRGIKEIECISERSEFLSLLETENKGSETILLRGIKPSHENKFNTFFSKKLGKDLSDTDLDYAEVGISLMNNKNMKIGDEFTLSIVDTDGFQNSIKAKIKGAVATYSDEFDKRIVRIPLSTLELFTGESGVHEIAIVLKDTKDTARIANIISSLIKDYSDLCVTTWSSHASYYNSVVRFYSVYYYIVMFIVIAVVFLLSFNVVMLSINERTREFGISMCLGSDLFRIFLFLLTETLILCFSSLFLAFTISFMISGSIKALGGIRIAPPPGVSTAIFVHIKHTVTNSLIAILLCITSHLLSLSYGMLKIKNQSIISLLNRGCKSI